MNCRHRGPRSHHSIVDIALATSNTYLPAEDL